MLSRLKAGPCQREDACHYEPGSTGSSFAVLTKVSAQDGGFPLIS